MKTAVYSWRVSPETKAALEAEARQQGANLAELLDRITQDWLATQRVAQSNDRRREARLRERALSACGTIAGGDPTRSSRAREVVRSRLRARLGGER